MQPFEIHNAVMPWNGCEDMRPWIIVSILAGSTCAGCFPIASEWYDASGFFLDKGHKDFAATGLAKNCYILDSHIIDVPRSCFRRQRGILTGELLEDFREYAGL